MFLYYFLRWSTLVLIGLLIYAQTFQFDFAFDDQAFIVTNPFIRDFGHVCLMGHVYPLTRLIGMYSFALNYYFNGLHAQGYHIFNFIVHLVGTGLVWALAGLIFKITQWLPSRDPWTKELPFFIAVLFLVHPCQTQAVTYITQRFESLATVFYLATIYCYLRARLAEKVIHKIILFVLTGTLSILGILTKEVVITVPAMMIASEWILFPKKDKTRVYIVLVVAGILLYLLFSRLVHGNLSVFLQTVPSNAHEGDVLTPVRYFLTQMRVFLTFLRLLVLPVGQNLDYDYPASTGLLHPPLTLVGLGMIGGIVFLIIKLRRRIPLIAFGLAWMLITFSINLAPRAYLIFEHKLYLISLGFFLGVVAAGSLLVRNNRTLVLILGGIVIVLSIVSFQRNRVWKDSFTLWNDVVSKSPHKSGPYVNRGLSYVKLGNLKRAIADYNKALEINPQYAQAYGNRGYAYDNIGNSSQAMLDFNKAIELNPNDEDFYYNRGLIFAKQNKFEQAFFDFTKAIDINPDSADAYNNRGANYFKQGRLFEAMSDYNKAIEIDPKYAQVYSNRGMAYDDIGNLPQAILDFNKAIELDPKIEDFYYNRGLSFAKQNKFKQALSDFTKAIEINPKLVDAYYHRGLIYAQQGRLTQAIADYSKSIAIDPDNAGAYNNRGGAYAQEGNIDQAIVDCTKAIRINAHYADAYQNRALGYFMKKEYSKGWEDVHQAESLGEKFSPMLIKELENLSGKMK